MPYIDFKTGKKVKIWEGITATMYHSDEITFGHVTLQKGWHPIGRTKPLIQLH